MGYVDSLMGRNERIALRTRQHWLVLVVTALVDGFLTLAALVIPLLIGGVVMYKMVKFEI